MRRFRGVDGTIEDNDELIAAVTAGYPQFRFDPSRWYLDHAFRQNGRTWILSKMWGRQTEQVLKDLSTAFPNAGVGFRRADTD
jgi:hypothetical protein